MSRALETEQPGIGPLADEPKTSQHPIRGEGELLRVIPETGWTVGQTLSQIEQEAEREGLPVGTVNRLKIAAATIRSLAHPPTSYEGEDISSAWILEQAQSLSSDKSKDAVGALAWNLRVFTTRLQALQSASEK